MAIRDRRWQLLICAMVALGSVAGAGAGIMAARNPQPPSPASASSGIPVATRVATPRPAGEAMPHPDPPPASEPPVRRDMPADTGESAAPDHRPLSTPHASLPGEVTDPARLARLRRLVERVRAERATPSGKPSPAADSPAGADPDVQRVPPGGNAVNGFTPGSTWFVNVHWNGHGPRSADWDGVVEVDAAGHGTMLLTNLNNSWTVLQDVEITTTAVGVDIVGSNVREFSSPVRGTYSWDAFSLESSPEGFRSLTGLGGGGNAGTGTVRMVPVDTAN